MRRPTSATFDLFGATLSFEIRAGSAASGKAEIKLSESGSISHDGSAPAAMRNLSRRLREFANSIDEIAAEVEAQR